MSEVMQPARLVTLALEEFGNYVCEVAYNLLKQEEDKEKLNRVCKHLHDTLQCKVPPRFADEVTTHLLNRIDELCMYNNLGSKLKLVRQEMYSAVIHPATTKLHLATCVPSWLPSMTLLRELKLNSIFIKFSDDVLVNGLCFMVALETFCYNWFCTDKVIEVLAKSCGQLRNLDISESRKVTNKSVSHINKLCNLKQLELSNTRICGKGITRLLKGLNSEKLVSFSCNSVNKPQLKLLVSKITDIRNFKFESKKCDLSILKSLSKLESLSLRRVTFKRVKRYSAMDSKLVEFDSLKHLHILSLARVKFSGVLDILCSIGSQLSELSLQEMKHISAVSIGETCPALKVLKILDCEDTDSELQLWKSRYKRPIFQSVEHVVIHLEHNPSLIMFVLVHCSNVKKVDCGVYGEDYGEDKDCPDILESVLRFNRMSYLEELHTMQHIKENTLRKLLSFCPKLSLITGRL